MLKYAACEVVKRNDAMIPLFKLNFLVQIENNFYIFLCKLVFYNLSL